MSPTHSNERLSWSSHLGWGDAAPGRLRFVAIGILSIALFGCGSTPDNSVAPDETTAEAGDVAESVLSEEGSGGGTEADTVPAAAGDAERFFANIRARLSSFSSDLAYTDVTEALPNVTFVDEIDGRYSVSELALLGVVNQVSPLEAYTQSLEGAETLVKFDDPDAVWRSYQADIVVSEVIAVAPGLRVREGDLVSFVVVADAVVSEADTRAALMGEGPVVVLGRRDGLVGGRPELFSVISHGGFWFQTRPDGEVASRSLPDESRGVLLPTGTTLDDIRQAGAGTRELVPKWER